jgi:GST-like protein
VYVAANCYAAVGLIDYPERWCSACDGPALDRLRDGTRARLHRLWDVFADQFPADTPFFGGARPGALDFLAVVVSRWCGTRTHLRQARPALLERLERIETHEDVAPVIARHWPPA